jgi:hypothetical protein
VTLGRGAGRGSGYLGQKRSLARKKKSYFGYCWQNSHQRVDEKKKNFNYESDYGGSVLNYCDRQTRRYQMNLFMYTNLIFTYLSNVISYSHIHHGTNHCHCATSSAFVRLHTFAPANQTLPQYPIDS